MVLLKRNCERRGGELAAAPVVSAPVVLVVVAKLRQAGRVARRASNEGEREVKWSTQCSCWRMANSPRMLSLQERFWRLDSNNNDDDNDGVMIVIEARVCSIKALATLKWRRF